MIKKRLALIIAYVLTKLNFISNKDYENYKFNLRFFSLSLFFLLFFLLSIGGVLGYQCNATSTLINSTSLVTGCTFDKSGTYIFQVPGQIISINSTTSTSNGSIVFNNAVNVTLNCLGGGIVGNWTGDSSLSYQGIYVNRNNITITNCSISNYQKGVRFAAVNNGTLTNSTFMNNYYDIYDQSTYTYTFGNYFKNSNFVAIQLVGSLYFRSIYNNFYNSNRSIYLLGSSNYSNFSNNFINLSNNSAFLIVSNSYNTFLFNNSIEGVYTNTSLTGYYENYGVNTLIDCNNLLYTSNYNPNLNTYSQGLYNQGRFLILKNCRFNYFNRAIRLSNAHYTNISNSIFKYNEYSIYEDYNNFSLIYNNTVLNSSRESIYSLYSMNSTISFNTLDENRRYGISLWYSNSTKVFNNRILSGNHSGIVSFADSYYTNISNNYVKDIKGVTGQGFTVGQGIETKGKNGLIYNNTVLNCDRGILITGGRDWNNVISYNTLDNITANIDVWNIPIYLVDTNNTLVQYNNITFHQEGVTFTNSTNLYIYNNTFYYNPINMSGSYETQSAIFGYELYKFWWRNTVGSFDDTLDNKIKYARSINIYIYNNSYTNVNLYMRLQGVSSYFHDLTNYYYRSINPLSNLVDNDEFYINVNYENITTKDTRGINQDVFIYGYRNVYFANVSIHRNYMFIKYYNTSRYDNHSLYNATNYLIYYKQNNSIYKTSSLNEQLNYSLEPNGELWVFNWSNYSNYAYTNALIYASNGTAQNNSLINGLFNVKFDDTTNVSYVLERYQFNPDINRTNDPLNITGVIDNSVYHKWSFSSLITNNMTIPVNMSFNNCSKLSYIMIVPKGQNPYIENNYTCLNNRLIIPRVNISYSITSDEIYAFYAYASLAELYQIYNEEVLSGSYQTYQLVLSYNATAVNIVKGEINYNGTIHNSTMALMPTYAVFTSSFNVPVVSSRVNTTFFWNISISNSTFSTYFNSSTKTQSIIPDAIHWCDYQMYNVTFLNFTTRNWLNEALLNTTFRITYTYNNQSMSYYDSSEDNYTYPFCFEPPDKNYIVDAMVEYDATGYAKNYYYLYRANLTNVTQNIDLYLLNNSYATLTKLRVYDESHKNLQNVIVTTQAYDVGTNTYKTVAMSRTDYLGEDITYLNWYNTYYKFILSRYGEIIYVSNITKITESPKNFQVNLKTFFNFDKFKDITYTLSFNNATGNFVLTYILPSGKVTSACLRVVKRTLRNDTTICNICETSMSATLYCNINAYGNGTYVGMFYATGSLGYIEALVEIVGFSNTIFNLLGEVDASMYAFLFATIVLVMFMLTPVLGIIGIILGVLGAMLMGFQPMNYMEFLGITLVGGIIIWILKR